MAFFYPFGDNAYSNFQTNPIGYNFFVLSLALFLDGVILDAQACLW